MLLKSVQNPNRKHRMNLRSTAILASITAVLTLGGCGAPGSILINRAQEATAQQLRDPTSAIFTNVTSPNQREVCGEVNGKNGFGAYAGKTRFTWHIATGAQIEPDEDSLAATYTRCMFDHDYRICKGENIQPGIFACNPR